jgi:hypothetical protein
MEVKRAFFWNGVLQLNDAGEHSFFDIKLKKTEENPPQFAVCSSDLPPLPVKGPEDVVKVTFLLENNVGTGTIRYKITEALLHGKTLECHSNNGTQNLVTITDEKSEWHFIKQTNWLLYYVSVQIAPEQVRKFMPLM